MTDPFSPTVEMVHGLRRFRLTNRVGVRVAVLELGAVVQSLLVPDGRGVPHEVVLGYDDPRDYLDDPYYLGAVVGRYANRIRDARFSLSGREYHLEANDGAHVVHGGSAGLSTQVWHGDVVHAPSWTGVRLRHHSPHGEGGFPGNLDTRVEYRLAADTATLSIGYQVRTDRPTVASLTNHTFFDLDGGTGQSVVEHTLEVAADMYLAVDAQLLPTGEVLPVAGTPFDLRRPTELRQVIESPHPQIRTAGGLDHTFVVRGAGLRHCCTLRAARSDLSLRVTSTEPGLDVYAAGGFDGSRTSSVGPLTAGRGIALETEHFSNSPNEPAFPSTTLSPDVPLRSTTVWSFGTS